MKFQLVVVFTKYVFLSFSRPPSGFDKKNLEWLEQLFRQTVGNEKEIRRDDFNKILITKNVSFKHYFMLKYILVILYFILKDAFDYNGEVGLETIAHAVLPCKPNFVPSTSPTAFVQCQGQSCLLV